jgi:hypothetical protein
LIFAIRPVASDISFTDERSAAFYDGEWFAKRPPPASLYSNQDGALRLQRGGDLATSNHKFTKGQLPLLSGKNGFYIEVTYRIDNAASSNWPAVWLMPAEHDALKRDHVDDTPPGFEQWMEVDIDEGGFGPGLTGTVHAWSGIWPNYRQLQNPNNICKEPLNRTEWHTYGVSFSPEKREVSWWLDGYKQITAGAPFVPDIATQHHYYLLVSANSHEGVADYGMTISQVRAFGP